MGRSPSYVAIGLTEKVCSAHPTAGSAGDVVLGVMKEGCSILDASLQAVGEMAGGQGCRDAYRGIPGSYNVALVCVCGYVCRLLIILGGGVGFDLKVVI